ncbi:MAG TPA: TatD family hydrolase [Bacteroidales bacterium]|nr:TatD family hydrolase [Bacteroidales bacterium]
MELIDTHAHIYLDDFDEDRQKVIGRAREAGVGRVYLPNIDAGSIPGMMDLCRSEPEFFFPMMGLHPTSVDDQYPDALRQVESWLDQEEFAAIGEIGIDLYWDKTYFRQQQEALKIQFQWAMDRGMPVVIHSRESFQEIFEVIDQVDDGRLYGIFHSFSGSPDEARRILDMGFKIGINGIVTFKNSSLDQVVRDIDINDLVVETDAPFLSPEPKRGRRNESAHVRYIADKIADIKQMPVEQVAAITTQNALNIFRK